MVTDAVRHFFPGSNTGAGFVGFFENLRSQAGRTVILKGGPGVGKSSLMKAVGQHYEEKKTPVVITIAPGTRTAWTRFSCPNGVT